MSASEELSELYPSKDTFIPHYIRILSKQHQDRKRLKQAYASLKTTTGDQHAHLNEIGEPCLKKHCHCDKLMDQPLVLDTGRGHTTWQYFAARQRVVKQFIGFTDAIIEEEAVDDSLEYDDDPDCEQLRLLPNQSGGITQRYDGAHSLQTEGVRSLIFPECFASSTPVPECTLREWRKRVAAYEDLRDESGATRFRVRDVARSSRRRALSDCSPVTLRSQVDRQEGLDVRTRLFRHARHSITIVDADLKRDWAKKMDEVERLVGSPIARSLCGKAKEEFLEILSWRSDSDELIAMVIAM